VANSFIYPGIVLRGPESAAHRIAQGAFHLGRLLAEAAVALHVEHG
jgi:hypothetical protein